MTADLITVTATAAADAARRNVRTCGATAAVLSFERFYDHERYAANAVTSVVTIIRRRRDCAPRRRHRRTVPNRKRPITNETAKRDHRHPVHATPFSFYDTCAYLAPRCTTDRNAALRPHSERRLTSRRWSPRPVKNR